MVLQSILILKVGKFRGSRREFFDYKLISPPTHAVERFLDGPNSMCGGIFWGENFFSCSPLRDTDPTLAFDHALGTAFACW